MAAARGVTEFVHDAIADTSWRMGVALTEMYAAFELRLLGDIEQAVHWGMRAAQRCPIGQSVFGATFSGEWAHCAALRGDHDTAARALEQAQHHRNNAARTMEFLIDLARPAVAAGQGRYEEAIELALDAADQARQRTVFLFEILALHQTVGFGGAPRVANRLRQLTEQFEGDLASVCATHAQAAAAGDPAGLLGASKAFEVLGLTLFAAEAAAQAGKRLPRGRPRRPGEGRQCACVGARRAVPWRPNLGTRYDHQPRTHREGTGNRQPRG